LEAEAITENISVIEEKSLKIDGITESFSVMKPS